MGCLGSGWDHRLPGRGAARRRCYHRLLHGLLPGEEGLQAPGEVWNGVIEGVAAPEAANNAATAGAIIHLLTLGVPGSGSTAVMLGR